MKTVYAAPSFATWEPPNGIPFDFGADGRASSTRYLICGRFNLVEWLVTGIGEHTVQSMHDVMAKETQPGSPHSGAGTHRAKKGKQVGKE
jgi:hypothetical protein